MPLTRCDPGGYGSPAWAGIDPTRARGFSISGGFPRVGGDRPIRIDENDILLTVPPRGRG